MIIVLGCTQEHTGSMLESLPQLKFLPFSLETMEHGDNPKPGKLVHLNDLCSKMLTLATMVITARLSLCQGLGGGSGAGAGANEILLAFAFIKICETNL